MRSSLFTFILEYRGGTAVAQVEAIDVTQALREWASDLAKHTGDVVQPQYRGELRHEIIDHDIYPLDGLNNAWCTHADTKGGFADVNIVKTRRS